MDLLRSITAQILNFIYGSGFAKRCLEAIDVDIDSNLVSAIEAVNTAVIPVASVLICMYFLLDLMDKVTNDNFSSDQFIKMLIKLGFSEFLISNISTIAVSFMNAGSSFMIQIYEATQASLPGGVDMTLEMTNDMGLFECLAIVVAMLFPFIASFLIQIAVYFMGYSRAIEMILRSMFAPIGCADFVMGGVHSGGMRYIKKMLAICLQGGIMVGIVLASSYFINTIITNAFNNGGDLHGAGTIIAMLSGTGQFLFLVKYFGVQLAMVGMLGTAKSISQEMVGA